LALPSSRDGALGELLEAARRYTAQGQESCSDLPNNPPRKPLVAGDPASAKARSENVNTFGGGTGGSNPVPSSRQSGLLSEFSFHVEKRRISAGVGGRGSRCGRKRRAERGEHSAVRGNISGGLHSSTAAPVMLVAVTIPWVL